jgi:YD repeat-containing protein
LYNPNDNTATSNFSRNWAAFPPSLTLALGEGSSLVFGKVDTSAWTATTWSQNPSWIQRYKSVAQTSLYRLQAQAGMQYTPQWIVLRIPVAAGGQSVAHYFDQAGNRSTFMTDGPYVDFTQTLHQQYRSAILVPPVPDGKLVTDWTTGAATAGPMTEISYVNTGNAQAANTTDGMISKIKDEWGRVNTYVWDTTNKVLNQINYLVQDANETTSPAQRIDITYDITTIPNQRLVSSVVYTTWDGKSVPTATAGVRANGNISRTKWFTYTRSTTTGQALLATVGQQVAGTNRVDTTYAYYDTGTYIDQIKSVTKPGEPVVNYTYGVSDEFKGRQITIKQALVTVDTTYTAEYYKQSEYHYDILGRLRKKRIRDYNPYVALNSWIPVAYNPKEKWLEWQYAYYNNGSTALTIEPSGKTTYYTYDDQGNLKGQAVYKQNPYSYAIWNPVQMKAEASDNPARVFRGATVSMTVKIADGKNQGINWYYPANLTNVVKTTGLVDAQGFTPYKITFNAPNTAITNAQGFGYDPYTVIATSVSDGTKVINLPLNVYSQVVSIAIDPDHLGSGNLPPDIVVTPGCVEAANQYTRWQIDCNGPRVQNRTRLADGVDIPIGIKTLAGSIVDKSITATIISSNFPNEVFGNISTPRVATLNVDIQGVVRVTPPAWSSGYGDLAGKTYQITLAVKSVAEPNLSAATITLNVKYFGLSKSLSAPNQTGWPPSVPGGGAGRIYQLGVNLINPPHLPVTLIWSGDTDQNGCFTTVAPFPLVGSYIKTIIASVKQYPNPGLGGQISAGTGLGIAHN